MRSWGKNYAVSLGRTKVLWLAFVVIIISLSCVLPAACETVCSPGLQRWELSNQDGHQAYVEGKYALAEQRFLQALKGARQSNAPWTRVASVLTNLGASCREQHKYAAAEGYFEEALAGKLEPQTRAMILRHYGGLLKKTQRLGNVSKVAEPGVMRRWENQSRQTANLVDNPLIIVDGVRSGYVQHGQLITATDLYRQVQIYRNAGLHSWANGLEAHGRKVFGQDFDRVWVAQAIQARNETRTLARAGVIRRRNHDRMVQLQTIARLVRQQADMEKRRQAEALQMQAEQARLQSEDETARLLRANRGELPYGALVQINVAPGHSIKVSQSPGNDMTGVQNVSDFSALMRRGCDVSIIGLFAF